MMMLRQGASLVNLQDIFDNLRYSQKMVSQKVLKLIQTWKPSKVKRILGEEPTQEFYNEEFTKYDITVQEGVLTDSQRQMYFRQLVDLRQLGAPVTGEMLAKAAPIQNKSEFTEELSQIEQQQAQQAQDQQKVEQQVLSAQMQQSQAKAISDIALGKERFTRSIANLGLEDERAAEAVENRSVSALNRVKAMKELQSMDDDRLLKYLQIVRIMEEGNNMKEEEIKIDNEQISARANEPEQNIPEVGGLLQELPQQPLGGA